MIRLYRRLFDEGISRSAGIELQIQLFRKRKMPYVIGLSNTAPPLYLIVDLINSTLVIFDDLEKDAR